MHGVGEGHRAEDPRAGVEQQLQAGRVVGVGGHAQRPPVVGVGARGEQQRGQARLVGQAGGALERGHAFVPVVLPGGVGIGAGAE